MTPAEQFRRESAANASRMAQDPAAAEAASRFLLATTPHKYAYNFQMLGRPIIQLPQDMVALQELIWQARPDLIIETGIAHGGSLMLSASMLALLDYCDAAAAGAALDPRAGARRVLGIDIEIRAHNREAIERHPMSHLIEMIEGSSVDPAVIARVAAVASRFRKVMVCLDSNHTHEHVLAELEAYAPLTSPDSYCCVFDTIIEDLPAHSFPDRPWDKGNNPKTAVHEYLRRLAAEGRVASDGAALSLEIDHAVQDKLLLSVAPDGYLRRVTHVAPA
jgi:cephalosporin hydroxylase